MIDFLNALSRWLSPLWEMSVTAAYAAAVVIVLRLLLKKRAPRQVLCLLWLVVFARLLIPASLESPLSIVPDALPGQEYSAEQAPGRAGDPVTPAAPQNPARDQDQNQPGNGAVTPAAGGQNPSLSIPEGVSPAAPARSSPAAFPWQAVVAGVWLTGAAALGGCGLVSYLRLRRRLFDAIRAGDGAWEHPAVDSPFILGVFRPRIYLPAGLTGQPRQFILCHERAHLRRLDHIVKPVCWIALALHWFNPLVWAAFLLMSRDIEAACDEAVVRRLGSEVKADYSYTLLALATGRRLPAPCPLAFDEGDAKGRIRNVLNYRRPALWAIVISVIAAALAAVCLLTDPVAAKGPEGDPDASAAPSAGQSGHYAAQENTGEIPAQVQADAEEFVRGRFEDLRDRRIAYAIDGTAAYIADEIDLPELDGWRIESLTGPYWSGEAYWDMLGVDRRVELWHVVYGYHSPTPDKAWNLANGGTNLTEDGWLTPINYGAEYLLYELGEDGGRTLLTVSGLQADMMSVMFRSELRAALAKDSMADSDFVEDVEFPLDREVDLDRDGVPEYAQVVAVNGNDWRLELWEGNHLLWMGLASTTHAGNTSFLLYSADGEDYLMEFEIHGGMGKAHGDYRIFTLENGVETTVRENHVAFDYCTDSTASVKDNFDPAAVAAFVDEADSLLERCFLLVDTGYNYRGDPPTNVQIDLRWLESYAPGFRWDDGLTTFENLAQFKLLAEYPAFTKDLNGDGRSEMVYITELDGGVGMRVELHDDSSGKVIWSDEGYYAHAGYNAVFLCTLNGKDYLLRYHPYMGQGNCYYEYQLFTLTRDGKENVVQENSVEFDINFNLYWQHKFDPEAIAAFMDEINDLLAHSVQLINTDEDLLRAFHKEGRLYDSIWWLDHWEPAFVKDESASLLENLRAFQASMEEMASEQYVQPEPG